MLMMSCADVRRELSAFHDEELSIGERIAIADHLERNDSDGLRRYSAFVKSEFAAYRKTLRDYYAQEQRWPDSVFWQRRSGAAPHQDQSRLSPLTANASL